MTAEEQEQTTPPPLTPPPQRKGRGCLGCGCGCFSVLLLALVILVGVGAILFFRVPQRIGLVKSPAEKLLSSAPDRQAAASLRDELTKGGVNTKGVDLYVLPITGKNGSLAYAVLDGSKGFTFQSTGGGEPVVDYLKRLALSNTAQKYGIQRVAIEYVSPKGESLVTLTAPTAAIAGFAGGTISRKEFLGKLEGKANLPAFFQEATR